LASISFTCGFNPIDLLNVNSKCSSIHYTGLIACSINEDTQTQQFIGVNPEGWGCHEPQNLGRGRSRNIIIDENRFKSGEFL